MLYGNRLKYIRESEALSLNDIAQNIGVDRRTMQHYESEYIVAPIARLNDICNYFNISFDYLFKFTLIGNYNNTQNNINSLLIGERLKDFRKENKITQKELASLLGIQQSVISDYEKGKYFIDTKRLYTICKKYHISADYILGRINDPKYLK